MKIQQYGRHAVKAEQTQGRRVGSDVFDLGYGIVGHIGVEWLYFDRNGVHCQRRLLHEDAVKSGPCGYSGVYDLSHSTGAGINCLQCMPRHWRREIIGILDVVRCAQLGLRTEIEIHW